MTSRVVFEKFVPPDAVEYCDQLYAQLGFEFKVKKARSTKLGDFRYDPKTKKSVITINNDLNPFAFLVTYLHEVAHHLTFKEFKGRVKPHGEEWKNCFANISRPVLNENVFPPTVLQALTRYFKNPKATSCSDPVLFKSLKLFDNSPGKSLDETPEKAQFIFKGKTYEKLEKKRTRWVCRELKSQRLYLIPSVAEVELINEP